MSLALAFSATGISVRYRSIPVPDWVCPNHPFLSFFLRSSSLFCALCLGCLGSRHPGRTQEGGLGSRVLNSWLDILMSYEMAGGWLRASIKIWWRLGVLLADAWMPRKVISPSAFYRLCQPGIGIPASGSVRHCPAMLLKYILFLIKQSTLHWYQWFVPGIQNHGLINYMDTKVKCRHLKKVTSKGTLRQVFI